MVARAILGLVLMTMAVPAQAAVDPAAYQAFTLWPGVAPPEAAKPRLFYLLDGEVRHRGAPRFERLRAAPPRLAPVPVWLVVRVDRLDWSAGLAAIATRDLERWQAAGNTVVGLQIDFDSATRGLARYRAFLADLRARLPARWRLSITGLMDWSANGDPAELAALRGLVDEVVIQTYQGRHTIPGYAAYLRRLNHFPIPWRIALVERGEWTPPPDLPQDSGFLGYVVFCLPRR